MIFNSSLQLLQTVNHGTNLRKINICKIYKIAMITIYLKCFENEKGKKVSNFFITWTIAIKIIKKEPLYNKINVTNALSPNHSNIYYNAQSVVCSLNFAPLWCISDGTNVVGKACQTNSFVTALMQPIEQNLVTLRFRQRWQHPLVNATGIVIRKRSLVLIKIH